MSGERQGIWPEVGGILATRRLRPSHKRIGTKAGTITTSVGAGTSGTTAGTASEEDAEEADAATFARRP